MTSTYEWLETYDGVGAALSLAIEGTPTTFGTDSMPGVYTTAASPYSAFSDPIGGMLVRGNLQSRIQLYAQDIEAGSMAFTIVDKSGALIGTVLREAYSSGHRTYLTSSITAGSTATINVKDTTGFAGSGTIYIGDEAIAYSGTTATTHTGITRAQYVINQTDSGAAFAPAHNIGNNVTTSATTAPSVTDYPRTWYGRFVHMFLHYRDPLTGTYNVASAATKLWSGRIESYRDNGDGTITITAKSALDLVNRAVGSEPWTGNLEEGIAFDTNTDTLLAGNSHTTAYNPAASLALTGRKSHDDVATAIQAQFDTWNLGGNTHAGDMWEIKLLDIPDGGPPRYQFTLFANTTTPVTGDVIGIGLHPNMWRLLGWEDAGIPVIASNGNPIEIRLLQPRTTTRWELRAPLPPIVYYRHNLITNQVVYVSKQVGTFATTTSSDLGMPGPDTAINGVIQIKESSHFDGDIFSVIYTAGSPTATLKIAGKLDTTDGRFKTTYGPGASADGDPQNGIVRLGDASRAPIVKQVYYQHGNAGDVILRAMLSTGGAAGYNHATYDTGPTSTFGAALPASLVDVSSFEELNDVSLGFVVTDAKPLLEHLEPILAVTNRYIIWKAADASSNPKLTIVRPHLDNTTLTSWQLTESNKATGTSTGRIAVERGAEGIVNRVVVKYGQGWLKSGDARTWIVEDIASQSDYGRRRTVTIDAPTVTNVEVVAPKTIGTALAYFARPLALAERTFNASLIRMAPGDSVSVTDNYLVDPATGSRGAFLYGWVLDTDFDLATGEGRVRIVFLPERPPRAYRFAPSARVDENAASGGYNAITKTLTTIQNEFSPSGASGDALSFVPGDKVHIYALDESAPLEWFDTVSATTTATTIKVLVGLGGFDSAKRYVVEYDDIATVQSSQKTSAAYIADDATLSTGGTPSTPYEWGGDELYPVDNPTRDYDVGMGRPNTTYATAGEPMSVHKVHYLVKGLNALLAYKTRSTHINQYLATAATVTGTTAKLLYCGWVPVYGHTNFGTRSFVVRLFIKQTGGGTATFTVRSSCNKPFGTSFTSYTFKNTAESVGTSTASSTFVWSSELSLGAQVGAEFGQLAGTFITVEGVGSGGGITATLQGIFVGEAAL